MSGGSHCFVEWKEEFVSQERGNRVVHYLLKDSFGESVLAIVGTERSLRHMFYVVAEEFVQSYGVQVGIHSGFKWRSRREVVDWLTSMTSKSCELLDNDLPQGLESFEFPVNESGGQGFSGSTQSKGNSEIVWSGAPWSCVKKLKHYRAFCRNGIAIALYSYVFVMGKGEKNYLAYLEDMYEDKRGQKKVKVRWFHFSEEVKGAALLRKPHQKEVFITPHVQVVSAECVDGPAAVLTKEHYFQCLADFPRLLTSKVHLCYRQFKNNRVKPFDLSKLRGYFNQPTLSCFLSSHLLNPDPVQNRVIDEKYEYLSPIGDNVGAKRARNGRESVTNYSGLRSSVDDLMSLNCEAVKKTKYAIAGRGLLSPKHVESTPSYASFIRVDGRVETLCQDSGIRGCWFQCTVLQVTHKKLKVRYDDLLDEDGSSNLEEWIPAWRFAMPDKLGMRFSGRLTIRPIPPTADETEVVFNVGVAVDAWWSDGWWEGVVTGLNADSVDDTLQIYFPGENLYLSLPRKDLRKSRDWVEGRWVNIQVKPDINSVLITESNLSAFPITSKIGKPDENSSRENDINLLSDKKSPAEMKDGPELDGYNCILEVKDRIEGMATSPVEDASNREDGDHKTSHSSDNLKAGNENVSETLEGAPNNNENAQTEPEPSGENCKAVETVA
ncbi:hypothetical protein SAY87_012093 [Trapa incisa]|uniref:BAH domain-containing protein n=1 Tax=Trapa incisa TaxID=236973 RepID=A0AAN7GGY3_9MYRT|nr:hypothetical protein SAY87_012093 [Trapa incisa]